MRLVMRIERVELAGVRRHIVEGGCAILVRPFLVFQRLGPFTQAGIDEYVALRRNIATAFPAA